MKVGLLRIYELGCVQLCLGPHPCSNFCAAMCMYACMAGVLLGFGLSLDPGVLKTATFCVIAFDSLLYMSLCLSQPGVPKAIMENCRLMERGVQPTNDPNTHLEPAG